MIFSYHLLNTNRAKAINFIYFSKKTKAVKGLIYAEQMSVMTLGAPVFSKSRILGKQIAFFAQWENEEALELFLSETKMGKALSKGWHIRLSFVRQWGEIKGFEIPKQTVTDEIDGPVVAITIAKMRFLEIPRFIRWGRPVEILVKEHPESRLSLASIKFPNIVSTFSIWNSTNAMKAMVSGHSNVPQPKRHSNAMKERDRKNFHYEFTTLRFKPIAEYGSWNKKDNYLTP